MQTIILEENNPDIIKQKLRLELRDYNHPFLGEEYEEGIGIWMKTPASYIKLPVFQHYLDIVKKAGFPRYYPGSPGIARTCLRKQDRLILLELHPMEFRTLRTVFQKDAQTKVYCQDGYAGLKSLRVQQDKVLVSEYMKYPKDSPVGLIGCGMCIINPPWQFDGCLHEIGHILSSR